MKFFYLALCLFFFISSQFGEELTCYELRTYHANEGKLEQLHARFRDHTMALFEKHGMTNLVYWTPQGKDTDQLVYLLGYPSRKARDASWREFRVDPEWTSVYEKSTKDGKLVSKVENVFLILTEYSPIQKLPNPDSAPLYEMRKYTTREGKLGNLDARFQDHTIELFEKHGITNLFYFHLAEGEEERGNTLLYFISAPSRETRDASFKAFSQDPKWREAKESSEKEGPILVEKGVKSTFLKTTDYSPIR